MIHTLHPPNYGFLPKIILEICSKHNYSRNEIGGQCHTDQKKCNAALRHPKIHPHTKFGFPTSNNTGDIQIYLGHDYSRNAVRGQGHGDRYYSASPRCIHIPNLDSNLEWYTRFASDTMWSLFRLLQREQTDFDPYWLQYRLPNKQTARVVTGRKWFTFMQYGASVK